MERRDFGYAQQDNDDLDSVTLSDENETQPSSVLPPATTPNKSWVSFFCCGCLGKKDEHVVMRHDAPIQR